MATGTSQLRRQHGAGGGGTRGTPFSSGGGSGGGGGQAMWQPPLKISRGGPKHRWAHAICHLRPKDCWRLLKAEETGQADSHACSAMWTQCTLPPRACSVGRLSAGVAAAPDADPERRSLQQQALVAPQRERRQHAMRLHFWLVVVMATGTRCRDGLKIKLQAAPAVVSTHTSHHMGCFCH
jgi:hypothetical protein